MQKKVMKKGFTLIELLIVIAIIGILAVALLPAVTGAPARARDAQRQADLNVITTALELYNSDTGHYPSDAAATGTCINELADGAGTAPTGGVLNKYMKAGVTPMDPSSTSATPVCYKYLYQGKVAAAGRDNSANVNYYLGAVMETAENRNAAAFPPTVPLSKGIASGTHFVLEQ